MKTSTKLIFASILASIFNIGLSSTVTAASPGALDPSFGAGGKVITGITGNTTTDNIAVQPDGKIILVSSTILNGTGQRNFYIARFNPNGALDASFGVDGIVITHFSQNEEAVDVAVQTDGRIVVVGNSSPSAAGGNSSCAVARYLPDGALDASFDGDGKTIIAVPGSASTQASAVALQTDGRIVVAGYVSGGAGGFDFLVFRLTAAGAPDTTFSGDGFAVNNFGGIDVFRDVVVQTDGKIVAAGNSDVSGSQDLALARYDQSGTLDNSFDSDGIVFTDFNSTLEAANSIALDQNGRIVAAGFTYNFATQSFNSTAARYNPNGSLDTTFDADGKLTLDIAPGSDDKADFAIIEAGGKIIIAGEAAGDLTVLRLNSGGSLDADFGVGGIVKTEIAGNDFAKAGALYGSQLVVAGKNPSTNIYVARYNLWAAPTQTGDFDGDGFTDSTVFRPSTGTWFTLKSLDGTVTQEQFGLSGDVPMDGDYDGDGRADLCIFRPSSGVWFFKRSSNGTTLGATFGQAGDKPQSGDYDKDGKSDIVVWRPSNGNYFVLRSSSNFSAFFAYPFGTSGDIPVQGGAQ